MQFGTKRKNETTSTGKGWIKYPKDGDNVLRFLEEMDDWTKYYEHFDEEKRVSYPCPGRDFRDQCPGCIKKDRADKIAQENGTETTVWGASKKYLVNVLDDSGYVNVWKIPASALDDLILFSDRFGTITDREYTITKYKNREGRIKYSVDRGDPDKVDLSQYHAKMTSHEQALETSWIEAWGAPLDADGGSQEPEYLPQDNRATAYPEEEQPVLARKPANMQEQATANHIAALKGDEEKIPSEPAGVAVPEQAPAQAAEETASATDSDDDEEQTISEDELRSMSAAELKVLIGNCGLEVPADEERSDKLADYLIAALSA